jgi:hypothetical protein|tara:strand:+ start:972 stop:1385 length:414 start_codon:yes stop_codon:yes gene_type:complete
MYNLTDLYNQALENSPIHIVKRNGEILIDNGFKLQKFSSKTEILNCSKNGDYFQEITIEEYKLFYKNGWKVGCLLMGINNNKRKLQIIEQKMKEEVNSRKNDKFIKNLKTKREFVMNKYSFFTQKLIKLNNKNGKLF